MFSYKDLSRIKQLYGVFKGFRDSLKGICDMPNSSKELKDWLSKEIISAELVIASLDNEMNNLKNKPDDGFLKVQLDGIIAKMKVYQDALSNCSDETEGKLLDALINLKRSKIGLESKIRKNSKPEETFDVFDKELDDKDDDDGIIPDNVQKLNELLVDRALNQLDLEGLSKTLDISLFYCVAEVRGTIEDAVKKAYKNVKDGVMHGELSQSTSEHFLVKVIEKDGQLGILVFTTKQ